jgi:SH3-like domain-containing protein
MSPTRLAWPLWAVVAAVGLLVPACAAVAQSATPGFASLMTGRVEARREPGSDKPVSIVFSRAGMPVLVLEWANTWARIQDHEGIGGWVSSDLLSRRRTGIVLAGPATSADKTVAVRTSERQGSGVVAILEPGVIVGVVSCDGQTCKITTSGIRGFVDQSQLWGVAPGEIFK